MPPSFQPPLKGREAPATNTKPKEKAIVESKPEFTLSEVEQKAYELLAKRRNRINLDSFADLYDKAGIERDKREVERLEKIYEAKNTATEKELKKLAELFEVLFGSLVELENWLGENVFVTETSKFDDYTSGIDMVAEFLSEGLSTQLGLAVDITFSSNALKQKITKIRDEIKNGKLPRIKYFISGKGSDKDRREMNNIPRVILGTDRKTLNQLAELVLDLNYLKKRQETQSTPQVAQRIKEVHEKLQNHPLQFELLNQIARQLETFGKYAMQMNKYDISRKYDSVLAIIEKIAKSKKPIQQSSNTPLREERMFRDIEIALDNILPSTVEID